MKIFAIVLWAAAAALAADPGFEVWKSGEMQGFEKKLAPKMNSHKVAVEELSAHGNHAFIMVHREGDGEAELHETQNDVMVIESGECTLLAGGKMVDPRTSAPHEIRGPSIRGGERRVLAPGDIVHVTAGVPHQVLVESGKQVTYFVVKITAR